MKPIVYFSREITPEKVLELYRALGKELPGKIAVKVHSGEEGNQNFLHPEFWKSVVDAVNGTVVECNTAYEGARNTTERHIALMEEHGWSKNFTVDILDAEGPDMVLDIPEGRKIKKNYVGKNIDKKAAIVFAEIDTEALASIAPAPIVYREPSRFPGMEQDLTFVVNRCQPILGAVKAENSPLVQKVTVLGTYSDITGKTITIRLSFSHPERTLTRDEVQAVVDGVVARLKGQGIELKK